tara:strand:- start:463 stop:1383 length:921 start_codon:yes stop_codon:yes gene_type:complete
MLEEKKITIKVPASTGNVGPGFDCIGLAVDIWNKITIEEGDGAFEILNKGISKEKYDSIPIQENLLTKGIKLICPELDLNKFKIISENNIPFAGGLGSSAASISAGLFIGNYLSGNKLNNDDLIQMAIAIEGHPDNATPCISGGLTISFYNDNESRWVYKKIETKDDLNIMTFVPNFISETNQSRKKIPSNVLLKDAVNNMSRVALLIDSFKSGDYTFLNKATQDFIHQNIRLESFPQIKFLMSAAIEAGALGAILSGSGPTLMAFSKGKEFTIDYELKEAARKHNLEGKITLTKISKKGISIIDE